MTKIETGIIEKIVPGGLRLLRSEKGIVFLNKGLPGEEVSYHITRKQKGTSYGELQEVISASTNRIDSECEYYPSCGGCALIETKIEHRREIKEEMLLDALRRVAKINDADLARVAPIQYEPEPEGRIRATLQINEDGQFGFFSAQSHDLIPISQCLALHPYLQEFLNALHNKPCPPTQQKWRLQIACEPSGGVAAALHQLDSEHHTMIADHLLAHTTCKGVHLIHEDGHSLWTKGEPHLKGLIADTHSAGPFLHDPATFTQSSFWGSNALLKTVQNILNQINGSIETCIELFCGAGHFSFILLDHVEDLLCIEGDPRAFFWLSENRGKHPKQDQMEIWQTKVDGHRIDLLPDICPIDLLFLDPPRDGVKHITGITEALQPQNIILVSCDLASGARDLGLLCRNGYQLQQLHPLDIFAHNHHLEWIAWLTRS